MMNKKEIFRLAMKKAPQHSCGDRRNKERDMSSLSGSSVSMPVPGRTNDEGGYPAEPESPFRAGDGRLLTVSKPVSRSRGTPYLETRGFFRQLGE